MSAEMVMQINVTKNPPATSGEREATAMLAVDVDFGLS